MSPQAQEILAELAHESDAVRLNALNKADRLSLADAAAVFEALADRARQEEDADDDSSALASLCLWAKERPELVPQALMFLSKMPDDHLPIWIVPKVKAMPAQDHNAVSQLIQKWTRSSNAKLKAAATGRLKK